MLFWLQISYAATSPALSKREKYPNFYRLAAADSSHNAARKTFIQHFGWDTVAILHQDLETFSLVSFSLFFFPFSFSFFLLFPFYLKTVFMYVFN